MEDTQARLADFIARYGHPYDAATDTYRRPPFAQPVKAGRCDGIFAMHYYHTKVPYRGIVPYVEHYTDPGDLVLDPFCGSGMTGVAALMTGRRAILSDLSPAAVHIARNYCTPVDVDALRREFERIKAAVKDEFDWLYGTTCDRCSGPATIQYTIWSDVFECGRCGGEIVLWDAAVDKDSGQVKESFVCPTCGATWKKRQVKWLRSQPVMTNYECSNCRPHRMERPTTAAEERRIAEIEAREIPYWYPTTPFREVDWEMWRASHGAQSIDNVSRFYTKRNLRCLSYLWQLMNEVGDRAVADKLRFAFTSQAIRTSKLRRMRPLGPGEQLSGTLYVSSLTVETNPLHCIADKVDAITEVWREADWRREDKFNVRVASATDLAAVPDGRVDYVFTDPPFGSNIFYADCSLIWEAWLRAGFTDQRQEAVVHVKHRNKNTLNDYARLMTESFKELHRVLKPGRWASVVFHNSDDKVWQVILDAAEAAGFELAQINAFDKEQLTFKGLRGAKGLERVTNKDIVLNLRKPKPGETKTTNGKVYADKVEQLVVEAIADFLAGAPAAQERTLQGLWNHALYKMLHDGSVQVSMAEVGEMLPHYFKQVDGAWYLRGESVMGGNVFDLKSDAGAITWLAALLANGPKTTGEIIPLWQAETAHLGGADTGRLDRLLQENFWTDKRTGGWRLPTSEERDKMSARQTLADEVHLRVVQRFLDGKLERRPHDVELAEWVRFCYFRGAYAEAVKLFPQIALDRLDGKLQSELRKIVAVCRMRAS